MEASLELRRNSLESPSLAQSREMVSPGITPRAGAAAVAVATSPTDSKPGHSRGPSEIIATASPSLNNSRHLSRHGSVDPGVLQVSPQAGGRHVTVTIQAPDGSASRTATARVPSRGFQSRAAPQRFKLIEDPNLYRPATPILNWEGPKRSLKPPKIQLWLTVTILVTLQMILCGIVPQWIDSDGSGRTTFLAVVIPVCALFTGTIMFMSTTRHLQSLVMLMQSINDPRDMDRVVESLQRGRFSRFAEPWSVQVHIIKMFCRLLKHHHGVNPVTGTFINAGRSHFAPDDGYDDEEDEMYEQGDEHGGDGFQLDAPMVRSASTSGCEIPQVTHGEVEIGGMNGHGGSTHSEFVFPNGAYGGSGRLQDDDEMSMYSAMSGDSPPQHQGSPTKQMSSPLPVRKPLPRPQTGTSPTDNRKSPSCHDLEVRSPTLRRPSSWHRRRSSAVHHSLRTEVHADPLGDNSKTWPEVLGSDAAPPGSIILQLLKQVKVGQDLSKVVLPVHILESRSLLEKLSDLFIHPQLFAAIAECADPVKRITAVSRWYISGFHMRPSGAKKPYNPILGETFECFFGKGTDHEVHYLAEQVSHHPPISVFIATHRASGTTLTAHYQPKSKLVTPNTGASIGDGKMVLNVPAHNSVYRMGWPSVHVGGLLSGPMKLEVVGQVKIVPENSDLQSTLHFVPKPWVGGKYDELKGTIMRGKQKLYLVEGLWHSKIIMKKPPQSSSGSSRSQSPMPDADEVFFDPDTEEEPLRPHAPHTSYPKPSRVVWRSVTVALRESEATAAQKAKEEIESGERELRRSREAREETYFPGFFRLVTGETAKEKDRTWGYIGPPLS